MDHEAISTTELNYDRKSELVAFDETKTGVKGLVDAGITKVPRIFCLPSPLKNFNTDQHLSSELNLPTIDLEGINEDPIRRKEDSQVKKEWYTRDMSEKKLAYNSNFDLHVAPVTNWRDTFYCNVAPNPPQPHELPLPIRKFLTEYSKQVTELGISLFELISEVLGLNQNHLVKMGCAEGLFVLGHYYPQCPQPELTIGASSHTDNDFMTILLQDDIGGLQILYQNQWTDVPYIPGALIVNIGDLLQMITNDKLVSSQHRVLANKVMRGTNNRRLECSGDQR